MLTCRKRHAADEGRVGEWMSQGRSVISDKQTGRVQSRAYPGRDSAVAVELYRTVIQGQACCSINPFDDGGGELRVNRYAFPSPCPCHFCLC